MPGLAKVIASKIAVGFSISAVTVVTVGMVTADLMSPPSASTALFSASSKVNRSLAVTFVPEVSAEQQAEKDALFSELDKLQDLDSLTEDDQVAGVYSAYWKWLAAYDILEAAQEITEPVLLLQGEEDYQTTMEDFNIWKSAVGGKENWQLISYPGLTHAFVPGEKAEGSSVYARDGKVQEAVILDIASFVEKAR